MLKDFFKRMLLGERKEAIPTQQREFPGANIIGDPGYLKIADNVAFGGRVTLYANEEITIGESTMIGMEAMLHTSTHNKDLHPMWLERIDRPIKIGSNVWIGTRALILPGTIIEDGAIVGAGAVVNKNVPRGAIVAGNPARIIAYRDFSTIENDHIMNFSDGKIVKLGFQVSFVKEDLRKF